MKKIHLLLIFLMFLIFINSCGKKQITETEMNTINDERIFSDICIQSCRDALSQRRSLDNGPCLLNPIKENSKWVCDVAHSPRESRDNIPENQCSSFREGKANRFIEVTIDCEIIKIV